MSELKRVSQDIEQVLSIKRNEDYVFTNLARSISNAYTQMMTSDEGYCFKFSLPITVVNRFYRDLNLDQRDISNAFQKDWGPTLTSMHKDSYYQILLLILYYAIKNDRRYLADNALMVILMKVWNGRKHKFFKFCNKKVMDYVINNMTTNRHEVAKHSNPVGLLKDYFVPTLRKKYDVEIKRDIQKLKRLFEQSHSRIYQIFAQNPRYNPATNRNEAQGGLLPLYIKAKKEGLYMQSNIVASDDSQFGDYVTSNNRDEITQSVVENITMNPNPQYPNALISEINRQTRVSNRIIIKILTELHKHQHHDHLSEIVSLILSRTNIVDKTDICNPNFKGNIRKNVIRSKNNSEIIKLQKLINSLLDEILPRVIGTTLDKYSSVHQIQIRNVIIYGMEYNLIKTICR